MKVTVKELTGEERANHDYRNILSIEVDGKQVFRVWDGEPEDATLSRDFNDCWKVADLMKLAHEAGQRGEPFEVEKVFTTLDEI